MCLKFNLESEADGAGNGTWEQAKAKSAIS